MVDEVLAEEAEEGVVVVVVVPHDASSSAAAASISLRRCVASMTTMMGSLAVDDVEGIVGRRRGKRLSTISWR